MVAPLADKVEENPVQIAVGEEAGTTVGLGTTMTLTVFMSVQPNEFDPVTE